MKFRQLTIEELQGLEQEFIQFLSANTVTGADWETIKKDKPQQAEELIGLFSDIVFEKIIKDIQYLEFRTPKDIKAFYCEDDKISLQAIEYIGVADVNLMKAENLMQLIDMNKTDFQVYQATKGYQPNREQELFNMLEHGAMVSKAGFAYKLIAALNEKH